MDLRVSAKTPKYPSSSPRHGLQGNVRSDEGNVHEVKVIHSVPPLLVMV